MRVTHLSMACFSMKRCASFSVIFSCSISSSFARFIMRISSIFSSMEAVFCSMRRRRSLVPQRSCSDWDTVCEEVGLLGASAMDFSDLEGRILVNIDSEEEGVLTAGCAGGRRVECHLPIARVPVTGTAVKADVTGLVGGHSGTEIHKGRANAIALLGRWLTLLEDHGVQYAVLALSGGAKENVIPKESSVTLVLPTGITEAVHAAAADFAAQMQAEYGTADPAICLQLTEEGCGEYDALDANSAERLRKALLLMPWGVQSMSMDVPGLVETSLNLGVAEMDEQEAILRFSLRARPRARRRRR